MKRLLIISLILIVSYFQVNASNTTHEKLTTSQEWQYDIPSQHLEIMLNDLIENNLLTSKKVFVLDNHPSLSGFNQTIGKYSFESVGKSKLDITIINTIYFWRIDLSDGYAHYEFYLAINDQESIKKEYKFEFINNQWQLDN